jgi:hypothetical protein
MPAMKFSGEPASYLTRSIPLVNVDSFAPAHLASEGVAFGTITVLALTARACAHAVENMRA